MKAYYVEYKMHQADEVHGIDLLADSKEDAYSRAVYEMIHRRENGYPYSAWVTSVTYRNGNYRRFNTFEGKPY